MSPRESLYKVADAMQMPIIYDGKGNVHGSSRAFVPAFLGLDFPVQLTAKAIFHGEQVGVVAHVLGDLYLMVAHNPLKGGMSAFVIDGAKLPIAESMKSIIKKNMTLREAVGAVRGAIVEAFALRQGQWSVMKIPTADAQDLVQLQGRQP